MSLENQKQIWFFEAIRKVDKIDIVFYYKFENKHLSKYYFK